MSDLLFGESPPNSVAFVLAHLLPLAGSTAALGSRRWKTGMVLPYRLVSRVAGPSDDFSDYPTIRVHTFAASETEAQREAELTERRMRILVRKPHTDVTVGDQVINCEWCEHVDGPREEPYPAESVVVRMVSEYDFAFTFTNVAV